MFKKGFNLLEIIIVIAIIVILIFVIVASRFKVGSSVKLKSNGDKGIITEICKPGHYVVKVKDKETIVSFKDISRD